MANILKGAIMAALKSSSALRGLPLGASLRGGGFSPATLFANNETGFWHEIDDLSTVFTDSGALTAGALEQPVGCVMDKSRQKEWQQVTLNGVTFTKSQGDGVLSVNGNQVTITGATTATYINMTTTRFGDVQGGLFGSINRRGICQWRMRADWVTATGVQAWLRGSPASPSNGVSQWRSMTLSNSELDRLDVATGTVTFTFEEIREWTGHHLLQATTSRKPVLSARYNFLSTCDLSNTAYWVRTALAGVVDQGDGSYKIIPDATNGNHYLGGGQATIGSAVFTVEAKAAGLGFLVIGESAQTAFIGTVNLATGVANAGVAYAFKTDLLEDGWVRISVKIFDQPSHGGQGYWYLKPAPTAADTSATTFAGNGVDGVLIRKPQVTRTHYARNTFSTSGFVTPRYQHVTTPTNYDAEGFPRYLRFDRVDDHMALDGWTGASVMDAALGLYRVEGQFVTASATLNDATRFLGAASDGNTNAADSNYGFNYNIDGTALTLPNRDQVHDAFTASKPTVFQAQGGNLSTWSGFSVGFYSGWAAIDRCYGLVARASMTADLRAQVADYLKTKIGDY